eukprot:snap_masked-scaffold_4-processed-gene-8.42-mRNA-1 protein AED:1.00 eAED:1.00 QI:0/-1/0/0/-1/1/1/0/94
MKFSYLALIALFVFLNIIAAEEVESNLRAKLEASTSEERIVLPQEITETQGQERKLDVLIAVNANTMENLGFASAGGILLVLAVGFVYYVNEWY